MCEFEDMRVGLEDWVWLRKYVKRRMLERGVEAGLSVVKGFDDDDAVGIKEESLMLGSSTSNKGRMNQVNSSIHQFIEELTWVLIRCFVRLT